MCDFHFFYPARAAEGVDFHPSHSGRAEEGVDFHPSHSGRAEEGAVCVKEERDEVKWYCFLWKNDLFTFYWSVSCAILFLRLLIVHSVILRLSTV